MSVNHDAVAALPIVGSSNKTLLRNVMVSRMPYVLADSDDSRNLIAIDPSTGAIIVDLLLLGRVFHYDPTDTTTAHDGTSCLVSSDGLRYKLAVGTDVFAYAVINNTTSVPPGSPTLGDAYLVAAGATGAWAGKSNYIAVKTNRGWEFVNFSIGRFIYVESVDSYYHKNTGGAWVTGIGAQAFGAASIPITALIGAKASFTIKVENQTTNAPPGSPVVPTSYIIGPAPTGAWAGQSGKLAICLVAGAFTIITPDTGDEVFDKALTNSFRFNGTAWVSSTGVIIATKSAKSIASTVGYGNIPADGTIPQITEGTLMLTLGPYTPVSAGSTFRIRFNTTLNNTSGGSSNTAALFLNSNANAVCAAVVTVTTTSNAHSLVFTHEFTTGSLTPFSLSVRMGADAGSGAMNPNYSGAVIATYLTLEEISA